MAVRKIGFLVTWIDFILRIFTFLLRNPFSWITFMPYLLRFTLVLVNEWSDYWPDSVEYIFTFGNTLPLRDTAEMMGELAAAEGLATIGFFIYNSIFNFPFFSLQIILPLVEWALIVQEELLAPYWNFTESDIVGIGIIYAAKVLEWLWAKTVGVIIKAVLVAGVAAATAAAYYVYVTAE